jgi:hypothetical protein
MSDADYTVELPLTLTYCPVCDELMNRSGQVEVWPEEGVTAPTIEAMAHAVSMKMAEALESDIIDHFQKRHRFRYWLWMRLRWKWVLG